MQNQIQIPLDSFNDYVCNTKVDSLFPVKCDSKLFERVSMVKTYQGILSRGQLVVAESSVFKCLKCGAIHDLNQTK